MSTGTPSDRRVLVIVVVVSLLTLLYSVLVVQNALSGVLGVSLLLALYLVWRFVGRP